MVLTEVPSTGAMTLRTYEGDASYVLAEHGMERYRRPPPGAPPACTRRTSATCDETEPA